MKSTHTSGDQLHAQVPHLSRSLARIFQLAPAEAINNCRRDEITHTIMPNVHAVKPIFTTPVNTSRNTFSHMAVGLGSPQSCLLFLNNINKLTCINRESRCVGGHTLGRGWPRDRKKELWIVHVDGSRCVESQPYLRKTICRDISH